MLILTRLIGEQINLGGDVHVKVLGIFGNQVRIGIEAPPSVSVHREEIYNRIRAQLEADDATGAHLGADDPDDARQIPSVKVIKRRTIVRPAAVSKPPL